MRFVEHGILARTVGTAGVFVVLLALTLGAVRAADDKIYVMKITLPTLNDSTHQFAKSYAAAIERDSGGRIKAEIYNSSQLGSGTITEHFQHSSFKPDRAIGLST